MDEFATFKEGVMQDEEVVLYLRGIAEKTSTELAADIEVADGIDRPKDYLTVSPVEVLIGLAAYALFRWVKDRIDNKRQRDEAETLRLQADIIKDLIDTGVPAKEARETVRALLQDIAKRSETDPLLKKALAKL